MGIDRAQSVVDERAINEPGEEQHALPPELLFLGRAQRVRVVN